MTSDTAIRPTLDDLSEGVQIIGFDWRYLYLNAAAARHARRGAGDLIGRRMTECYPGIDRTPIFAVLRRVMQARRPEQFLSEFIYPDGAQRWFELLVEPVPDGLRVLSVDIGDRPPEPLLTRPTGLETVLLVEPDDAARDLMHQVLATNGYAVVAASNVWDALAMARPDTRQVDLLLTDIVLPEMSGPELARQLIEVYPRLRILYVSGFSHASALGGATLSRRLSFLPKPLSPSALLGGVRDALDR